MDNLGLSMTIFIMLAPFIMSPSIRVAVGGEAFFIKHQLAIWAVFAFSGIYHICVCLIKNHHNIYWWINQKINAKRNKMRDEYFILSAKLAKIRNVTTVALGEDKQDVDPPDTLQIIQNILDGKTT